MGILEDCIDACKAAPGTVVFPDCLDSRVLTAATRLKEEKVAVPLLVQSPFMVRSKILSAKERLSGFTIIDHTSKDVLDKNMEAFTRIQNEKGKAITQEQAEQAMRCSLAASAMMVRNGDVEVGIAGNLSSTADVLRAGISILPRKQKTISSFFLMIAPDGKNQYILADCAVVPEPSPDVLADIAIASAEKAKNLLKEEPRVAMLSFSTKGSSKHPRAEVIREAVERVRKQTPEMMVDGELQLDAAIVPQVASLKAPASPICGNANVLVFPSLEAGNIGYKMLQRMAGFTALGPFLQGFEGGWHDLSRGCSADDLFNVAVLGLCMQRGDVVRPVGESPK
ncbi:phosphotransacetylase [Desulfospira joergensenii]|uniref:phosphotransacetylase n=1 Tax=Desulfospira joergensenii TaxID=53329 RepID=UPI0003B381F2|nr:phosphotransacetylase [Desulfospira joergensenii]